MIQRISKSIESSGFNTTIIKKFQRGLQFIESRSAYNKGKLYFRGWRIEEYKHRREISQAYNPNPIKSSRSIIDYYS